MSALRDELAALKLGGIKNLKNQLGAARNLQWYQLGLEENGARQAALAGSTKKPGGEGYVGGKGVLKGLERWARTSRRYGDEGKEYNQREYNDILAAERKAAKKARTWK